MLDVRCTVRGCGAALPGAPALARARPGGERSATLRGPCGHCFDIARSGYINLLQPQDRRARAPGDSAAAVAARRRLFDAGAGAALIDELAATIAGLGLPPAARTLDVGCGEGSVLGALTGRLALEASGVDLSARAADLAARRYPGLLWLVANADRALPFGDQSLDLVLSVSARRNPAECARVLGPAGRLVVAVPGPDDLEQLLVAALGGSANEDRTAKLIEEHAASFEVADRRFSRERRRFGPAGIDDLLTTTYRGGRAGRRARAASLDELEVTLSHDIVVFRRTGGRCGH